MHPETRLDRPGAGVIDASPPLSWLTNVNIVDIDRGEVASGRHIELAGEHIAAITDRLPNGAHDVLDCGGRYVVPGLISCHSHLSITFPMSATDPEENPAATVLRAAARARDALAAGITTLRCVHEQHRVELVLRSAQRDGWIDVPRIFGAGRAITTPTGHGAGMGCAVAEGEIAFYEAACAELGAGADHVKIFISGGLARADEDLGASEMTDAELDGVVRAAAEHDTYVVAHSGGSSAIRQALERGVRCFEHAYELDAATAELLALEGAYVTPTLIVTDCAPWMRAHGFEEAAIERASSSAERHVASIKRAIAAGIPILAGTDLPPADDVGGLPATVVELQLLERAGLSRREALASATTTPASLLGADDRIGRIQPGMLADLLVVDDDPLADLTALASVHAVVQGARLVGAPR